MEAKMTSLERVATAQLVNSSFRRSGDFGAANKQFPPSDNLSLVRFKSHRKAQGVKISEFRTLEEESGSDGVQKLM
jgi:hypothetical protein